MSFALVYFAGSIFRDRSYALYNCMVIIFGEDWYGAESSILLVFLFEKTKVSSKHSYTSLML